MGEREKGVETEWESEKRLVRERQLEREGERERER
jgi:hypothetical protein